MTGLKNRGIMCPVCAVEVDVGRLKENRVLDEVVKNWEGAR